MLRRWSLIIIVCLSGIRAVDAAEWTLEPALSLISVYNDNVGMRSSNEQSATGYTVAPRIDLKGQEPNWDVGMNALIRTTRYNGVEDVDSDTYFLTLANGYKTERHNFRLDGSLSKNTNYDTNYDTQLPSAGLVDDRTITKTTQITPSWSWRTSESSTLSVSLSTTDIHYEKVTTYDYRDYQVDSATVKSSWDIGERSQLGFTLSYSDYQNDKRSFAILTQQFTQYLEYQNSVYQLDYVFEPSELSKLSLSVGSRKLDSVSHDEYVSCSLYNPFTGQCLAPVFADIDRSDDGTVVSFDYTSLTEISSLSASASRIVVPSSYGGAQEQVEAIIRYKRNISERFSTALILNARETTAIGGLDTRGDRKRQRIEPKFIWKISKFWALDMSYRFIKQNLTATDTDSESNEIYVNLNMRWPRLASTY